MATPLEKKIEELLAENEHVTWASWMEWVFDEFECGKLNEDDSFTIRADRVRRWKRQIETKYADLTEEEKESDRMQIYGVKSALLQLLTETIEAVVPSRLLSIKDGKSEHYAKGYNAAIDQMTTNIAKQVGKK